MMIAASTIKGGIDDVVTEVFGRAPTFTLVEIEEGKIVSVDVVYNKGLKQTRGAGIAAVQFLVSKNVNALFTGRVGPNAFSALKAASIKLYRAAGLKVGEAVLKYLNGELKEISTFDTSMGKKSWL